MSAARHDDAESPYADNGHEHDHDTQAALARQDLISPLPTLTIQPVVHSGCCLALSSTLIHRLYAICSSTPGLVLSIGSGFGLLEALLLNDPYFLRIIGIEVEPSPNRYLPAASHRVVRGTRFLHPVAAQATTWLFVYPRRPGMVQEYIAGYDHGNLQQIIWIGPKADWSSYAHHFPAYHVRTYSVETMGGKAYELIAIATRTRDHAFP